MSITCPKCKIVNASDAQSCKGCGVGFIVKPATEKTSMQGATKLFLILLWFLPIVGVAIGLLVLLGGMSAASSAPQEAVVCALACACAILPYCLARAVTELVTIGNK